MCFFTLIGRAIFTILLLEIARTAGKYEPEVQIDKTELVVAAITHAFCRLVQDP
jgi:hypothetical protein